MKAGITRLGSYTWLEAGDPLDLICGRMLQVGGMVSFDLETTGLNPWVEDILLVAFTQDGVNSYVFDPAIVNWAPFIKLVETVPCSNHNLREFDAKFIRVKSGAKVRTSWDTMVAYQLATAGICSTLGGAGLEELAKKFLNIQLTKAVRKSFTTGPKETTLDQVIYAAEDAQAAHRLIPITRDLLEEAGHLQHMLEIEIPFMPVLEDMEIGGAPFDIDAGLTLLDKIQDEVNQQKAEISAALSYRDLVKKRCPNKCRKAADGVYHRLKKDGGEICDVCQGIGSITEEDLVVVSPTSRLQVVKAFERLKVKVPITRRNNGSESESISAESLKQIDHPVAKMLIALSTTNKLLTGFMIPLTKPISEGGRYNPDTESIHTTYTQAFTSTNRLSSREPNLQNIPSKATYRNLFKAKVGYLLVGGDLSQYEVRVIAEASGDPTLRELFCKRAEAVEKLESYLDEMDEVVYSAALGEARPELKAVHDEVQNLDLHSTMACLVFKLDPKDVDFDSDEFKFKRKKVKAVTFGIPYGATEQTIAQKQGISEDEAKALMATYFKRFPLVETWIREAHKASDSKLTSKLASKLGYPGLSLSQTTSLCDTHRFYILPTHSTPDDARQQQTKTHREASNQPIQGTNGVVLKLATTQFWGKLKEMPEAEARPVLSVHDEVVTLVKEGYEKQVARLLKQAFKDQSGRYLKTIPTEVSIVISPMWEKG